LWAAEFGNNVSSESIYIISHPRSKIAIRGIINHISGDSATRSAGKSVRDSGKHPGKEMIRCRGRQRDERLANSMIQLAVRDTERRVQEKARRNLERDREKYPANREI
jgi:hypothetical protein